MGKDFYLRFPFGETKSICGVRKGLSEVKDYSFLHDATTRILMDASLNA
jgi:hypothetical protein